MSILDLQQSTQDNKHLRLYLLVQVEKKIIKTTKFFFEFYFYFFLLCFMPIRGDSLAHNSYMIWKCSLTLEWFWRLNCTVACTKKTQSITERYTSKNQDIVKKIWVWLAPIGSLYFFVTFSVIKWSIFPSSFFRWSRDSNPHPRTMAQIMCPERLPLDQGASLTIIQFFYLYFKF